MLLSLHGGESLLQFPWRNCWSGLTGSLSWSFPWLPLHSMQSTLLDTRFSHHLWDLWCLTWSCWAGMLHFLSSWSVGICPACPSPAFRLFAEWGHPQWLQGLTHRHGSISMAPRADPQARLNPSKKWALQCKKCSLALWPSSECKKVFNFWSKLFITAALSVITLVSFDSKDWKIWSLSSSDLSAP